MAIKRYKTQAEWKSANKSTTESTIGLVAANNTPVYNGVNVLTSNPVVGDAVVLDENKKIKFLARNTFSADALPTGWTGVGVVGINYSKNKVLVLNKTAESKKWASVYIYTVTGSAMTDGVSHTGAVKLRGTDMANDFTWQADNVEAFTDELNAYLEAEGEGSNWHAYVDDDGNVQLVMDNFTTVSGNSIAGVTLTVSTMMATDMPMQGGVKRYNGVNTYFAGCNHARMVQYYSASGKTPTANVALNHADPVNKTSFDNSEFCAALRDTYGDYDAYIESHLAIYPDTQALFSERMNDVDGFASYLVNKTYKKKDGSEGKIFAAADYCAAVSYDNPDLAAGTWHLPTIKDLYEYMSNVTYGLTGISVADSDYINQTLKKLNGTQLSCTASQWSSARGSAISAWLYGSYGLVISGNLCNGLTARAVIVLEY